jgi:hypothetical protein
MGHTVDCWQSQYEGQCDPPVIHSFVQKIHNARPSGPRTCDVAITQHMAVKINEISATNIMVDEPRVSASLAPKPATGLV